MAVGGIYLDKSRSFFLPVVIKMIFFADEACMPKKPEILYITFLRTVHLDFYMSTLHFTAILREKRVFPLVR